MMTEEEEIEEGAGDLTPNITDPEEEQTKLLLELQQLAKEPPGSWGSNFLV